MAIEFMPMYVPATEMVRCAGDDGCGALLISGDAEMHQNWHDKVWPHIEITVYESPERPEDVAQRVFKDMEARRQHEKWHH